MYLFLHRYCTCPLPPLFIDSKLDVSIIYSKNITLSRAPCQSMNIKLSAYGYYSTVRDLHFTFLFSFQKKMAKVREVKSWYEIPKRSSLAESLTLGNF